LKRWTKEIEKNISLTKSEGWKEEVTGGGEGRKVSGEDGMKEHKKTKIEKLSIRRQRKRK
jgi:hypothetical protein